MSFLPRKQRIPTISFALCPIVLYIYIYINVITNELTLHVKMGLLPDGPTLGQGKHSTHSAKSYTLNQVGSSGTYGFMCSYVSTHDCFIVPT